MPNGFASFTDSYWPVYHECIRWGFAPHEADKYANRRALDAVRASLLVHQPKKEIANAAPYKPVVMRTISDLAEVVKPIVAKVIVPMPPAGIDLDMVSDEEWKEMTKQPELADDFWWEGRGYS